MSAYYRNARLVLGDQDKYATFIACELGTHRVFQFCKAVASAHANRITHLHSTITVVVVMVVPVAVDQREACPESYDKQFVVHVGCDACDL